MSPEAMRARFYEAMDERDAIRAKAKPLRDEYDAKSQEHAHIERETLLPLRARLKEIEAPCFDLDQELGRISRALNGKIGPRPE